MLLTGKLILHTSTCSYLECLYVLSRYIVEIISILCNFLNGLFHAKVHACTCGNCECNLLTNISKFYCCKELEGIVESLTSEIVLEDLEEGQFA